mmetsp:Transcript_66752/g.159621  ORF Transcript_66752/g.159621 Transcript_66752/m.159621 type:complete len:213 (-) Transcript_66752:463-1101(-)
MARVERRQVREVHNLELFGQVFACAEMLESLGGVEKVVGDFLELGAQLLHLVQRNAFLVVKKCTQPRAGTPPKRRSGCLQRPGNVHGASVRGSVNPIAPAELGEELSDCRLAIPSRFSPQRADRVSLPVAENRPLLPTHDAVHRVAPQVLRKIPQVPAPVHVRHKSLRIIPQALRPPPRALVEHGLWVLAACDASDKLELEEHLARVFPRCP